MEEQVKTPPPPAEIPTHNRKRIWIIVSMIVAIILILVGSILAWRGQSPTDAISATRESLQETIVPSPTPFPLFAEMTIPYLRTRAYKSSLTERELYSQNGSYNSYLTSYDSDGNRINALLTIPTGEEPEGGWPAVIFIHGYIPPTIYETTSQYSAYVDYIARNGLVVLKIDLRGHANSQGEPGGGYFGSDYIIDTLNAYAALETSGFVNPKKIGLWGHSMAGNVSLRAFAAKPNIPAVVIWAGAVYSYTDRIKYGIQDNSYRPPTTATQQQARRKRLTDTYGEPTNDSPFWKQVIPTNYLQDLKGAIEIHHAVDDDVVNIGYSRDLMELLDATSVQHELYEYTNGGHNIQGNSFNQAMNRTVEFYKEAFK